MDSNRTCWGLLRRRQCLVPTWRGWLIFMLTLIGFGFLAVRGVGPFLTLNEPVPDGELVVEGWAADYALEAAIAECKQHHYRRLFVTGGPLESGGPLSEYKTYAELGAATLRKLGLETNVVQAVPAPWVRQDRTYTSGVTLGKWFRDHGESPARVNLLTVGPHARRSRLLFEKALGKGITVGVIAIPPRDYELRHWWRSSAGVRNVTGEAAAYLYARLIFRATES